ncbi:MAG: hypothetical protein ACRELB_02445, partial [Polyangiaceae bacterium]
DVSRKGTLGEQPVGNPARVAAWGVTLVETASGAVLVARVEKTGALAGKVSAGEVLATCDRVLVTGLTHLESLLLQAGRTVTLGFRSAAQATSQPREVVVAAP